MVLVKKPWPLVKEHRVDELEVTARLKEWVGDRVSPTEAGPRVRETQGQETPGCCLVLWVRKKL